MISKEEFLPLDLRSIKFANAIKPDTDSGYLTTIIETKISTGSGMSFTLQNE